MKVAISLPDDVFTKAEAFAKMRGLSRSRVYAKAIDEYIARQGHQDLTQMANALADSITEEERRDQDAWLRASADSVLKNTDW